MTTPNCPNCGCPIPTRPSPFRNAETVPNPRHHDPFINTLANITTGIIALALVAAVIIGLIALTRWAL